MAVDQTGSENQLRAVQFCDLYGTAKVRLQILSYGGNGSAQKEHIGSAQVFRRVDVSITDDCNHKFVLLTAD